MAICGEIQDQCVILMFKTEIKMVSNLMSMLVWTVIVENASLCNVMFRQPRVRASRASPGQKWPGLRVDCCKNFSRAKFLAFWSTQMVDIYLSYLPMKQI